MYSAYLCRFIGGPADGELRLVRGEHGAPPPHYEVRELLDPRPPVWEAQPNSVRYRSVLYLRRPDLDGRWFYEYQTPKEG